MNETTLNLLVALALLVGIAGIVVPVLPGVIVILIALLVWAIVVGGTGAWVTFAVATVILAAGQVLKYLLPGRAMQAAGVPNRSLVIGGVLGIVGFFVVPVIGLPIGFILGVHVAEHWRVKNWPAARDSTWVAMKATGFSMLIELVAAMLAATVWVIALFRIG